MANHKTRLSALERNTPGDGKRITVKILQPGELPTRPAPGDETIWVRPLPDGGSARLTARNYDRETTTKHRSIKNDTLETP